GNWQGGSVRRQDRGMRRFLGDIAEDLSFDFQFLRGRFDYNLDIAHFNRRAGGNDAGSSFLSFLFRHDSTLDGLGIRFLDLGETVRQFFRSHVAQNYRNSARAEPLRDAAAHYPRADHRRVRNFLRRWLRAAAFVFLRQEKIADQILRRVGLTEFDDGIELQSQRVFDCPAQPFRNYFSRARRRRIPARAVRTCFSLTGGCALRLSLWEREGRGSLAIAQFFSRGFEQLFARNNFINQLKLFRFLRGIQLAFHNHFRRFFRADQTGQARATAPGRDQTQRGFWQANPRGRIIACHAPVTR